MTLNEAIEKAIKGGYNAFEWYDSIERIENPKELYGGVWGYDKEGSGHHIALSEILINPLFWQSLGKAMGVKNNMIGSCDGCGADLGGWKYQQHRFIDHLQDGKSIESFFEQLT